MNISAQPCNFNSGKNLQKLFAVIRQIIRFGYISPANCIVA